MRIKKIQSELSDLYLKIFVAYSNMKLVETDED